MGKTLDSLGDRCAVLRRGVATYVDLSFICPTEEAAYASRLALIVQNGSELTNAALITFISECVTFRRAFD